MDQSPSGNLPAASAPGPTPAPTGSSPQPARRRPRWLVALVVTAGGLLLAGCNLPTFGAHKAISTQGQDSMKLWQGFFITGVTILVIVFALIMWAVLRYRRR